MIPVYCLLHFYFLDFFDLFFLFPDITTCEHSIESASAEYPSTSVLILLTESVYNFFSIICKFQTTVV